MFRKHQGVRPTSLNQYQDPGIMPFWPASAVFDRLLVSRRKITNNKLYILPAFIVMSLPCALLYYKL